MGTSNREQYMCENDMNAYILYAVRLNKLYHSFFLESLRLLIEVDRIIGILFRIINH